MFRRPIRRGALAALAATLLLAAPVSAHPFFDPSEVPVDSLTELTLEIAHGCAGDHDEDAEGDGEPTREVAIEVPEAVSWVEPAEHDGWDLELETDEDGTVEVIVYAAEDGTDEPAPGFDLEAVHRGEVGDEVHWRILQACDGSTHRWVGTDEEPAEEPAVTVVLAAADPDSPPPPEPEQGDDTAESAETDPAEAEEPDASDDELIEDPDDEAEDEDLVLDEAAEVMPGWLLIVVLVVTLAIAAVVLLLRNRDGDQDASTTS